METLVVRGAGDRPGEDIEEVLLSTRPAQVARGRYELDENGSAKYEVDLVVLYRPGLRNGKLVQIEDEFQGETYKGKIVGLSFRVGEAAQLGTEVDITLRIPTDFYG